MIDFGQLHVQSSFKIQRIEDVHMEWKPNEHGRMVLRGIVADTDNTNSAIHAAVDEPIILKAMSEKREERLFKGVIASIKTTSRNGVFTVELEAISGTIKLDRTIHNRSFQDKGMSYESLINNVIAPYQGNDVLVGVGENESIGTPIYQYGETDWALLKRLASQLDSVIYCDLYESAPRVYFGFPEGRSYTIPNETSYTASKDMKAYRQSMMNGDNLPSSEFFSYEIETGEKYVIGDRITFRNKQLVISEAGARMVGGLLRFTYRLSRTAGVRSERIHNHKLTGLSLSGKVLAVKGELVQLHLDIDKEQSIGTANWYPFAPPTGNVMYCMPQVGAHASLYLPDSTGEKAMVIGSVRLNGEACAKTGDPNNRYLGTEHGSELELTPSAINLTGGGQSPLKVTIDDATGVKISSPTRLTLDAMQDISIYTPKKINISAQSLLVVKKRDVASGITVDGEYHVLGASVVANGSDRESFAPYDEEPQKGEPPPPPPKKKFSWGKLLGNVVAGLAVVAVVAVAAAFTVATLGAGAVVVGAVLAGGLAAGAIGVGAMAISDIARGEVSSMGSYMLTGAREAFIGAITGAVFGPLGVAGTFAGRMAMEGVEGAFGSIVNQLITDGKVNWKTVMFEAGISAALGGLLSKEVLGKLGGWLKNGKFEALNKYLKDKTSPLFGQFSDIGKSLKNGWDNFVKQLSELDFSLNKLEFAGIPGGNKGSHYFESEGLPSGSSPSGGTTKKPPEGTGKVPPKKETKFIIFNKTHKNAAPKPRGKGPNGGRLESHHGLQGEWAKENLAQYGYDYKEAPTVTLETGKGHPHTDLTNRQNERRDARVAEGKGKWSSTLQEELTYIVEDFKELGYTRETIETILEQQYKMLDKLKVPYRRINVDEYF
ncbi:hypothetical protein [Paenibacillus sp. MMS18-CY102]|uniref:hypothetical protein n=1 Tax=Paenibacillus sp. MMS18-CY102 TaxID=2682849 RepID=UPI0013659CF3|nr:hypothetical protein [Paenibacillus sp. MMS18-CY102]MWC31265.1 hypothetical protein [Paenibacillus sp. MMS18-CY102]